MKKFLVMLAALALSVVAPAKDYQATVLSVHDGDTAKMSIQLADFRLKTWKNVPTNSAIQLGWGVTFFHTQKGYGTLVLVDNVRFFGIQAPEIASGKPGADSRDFMKNLIDGKHVTIKVNPKVDREKYGRVLASVYVNGTNCCQCLLSNGLAVAWFGEGVKPDGY